MALGRDVLPSGARRRAGAAAPSSGREPVAPSDAVWLQDSPTNLMIINAVYTTDHIDLDTAREVFRRRILGAEGGRRYPRFTRRVVEVRGRFYWEEDPEFDVARHIVSAPPLVLETTAALQAYVGDIADRPLPPDRPRWQIQHVEHFEDGGSAFVARFHHCMADGIAFLPIILSLMDEMEERERAAPAARDFGGRLRRLLLAPVIGPVVLLRRVVWRPDRHALHGPPVSGKKKVAWTRPFPLDVVKAVKNRFGATVNDVLMACVSGAIGRYLERHAGQRVPHIRVSMPVNMRGPGEPLRMENRFAAVPLTLPIVGDLRAHLDATKRHLDTLKRGLEPLVIYGVVKLFLTTLPPALSRRLIDFFANKCTSVVTNVPGPSHELTIAGRRVRTLMFWVPQRASIGVGISILTFAGRVQLGVIADTVLVDDPMRLVRVIEEEFEALESQA